MAQTEAGYVTQGVVDAAASKRSETEYRAVLARRALLVADLMAEGMSAEAAAHHATPEVAARMLDHERNVVAAITGMFAVRA